MEHRSGYKGTTIEVLRKHKDESIFLMTDEVMYFYFYPILFLSAARVLRTAARDRKRICTYII